MLLLLNVVGLAAGTLGSLAAWLSDCEIACSPEEIRAAFMIRWRRTAFIRAGDGQNGGRPSPNVQVVVLRQA
jgi:hypothetical protein